MTDNNHAIDNAMGWFASIVEMVDALRAGRMDTADPSTLGWTQDDERDWLYTWNGETYEDADKLEEDVEQHIHESVLSVEVRGDWVAAGQGAFSTPAEFKILLSTGGPALRLIGELDEHGTPDTPRLEYQDWGTPWTKIDQRRLAEIVDPRIVVTTRAGEAPIEMRLEADEKAQAYLLDFARQFYFEEG